jgi:hypothetical protein
VGEKRYWRAAVTRLLMLVEGQSEELFVKHTLAPYLSERGVYLPNKGPSLMFTKRMPSGGGFRGGVSSWGQILNNLRPLLQDTNAWITTLLDFYGLPDDFPGYQDTLKSAGTPHQKVEALQARFTDEIQHPRFIPFLALHELEAWLFCSPKTVADHFDEPGLSVQLEKAVREAGEPELINHGKFTHPKARLEQLKPSYKETSDGATLLGKIGMNAIRADCAHVNDWLTRLEALGSAAPHATHAASGGLH